MDSKSSIIRKYRAFLLSFIIIAVIASGIIMIVELNRMTKERTEEYARIYTRELSSLISTYLERDILLAERAASNPSIVHWLKDEDNNQAKEDALNELLRYNQSFYNKNSFVAFVDSSQIYYIENSDSISSVEPEYINEIEDLWYPQAINLDLPYSLNIERHPLSTSTTLWINFKVELDGELVAFVGTGIDLNSFINESDIFKSEYGASILFVDDTGKIQLDATHRTQLTNLTLQDYVPFDSFHQQLSEHFETVDAGTLIEIPNYKYSHAAVYPIAKTNWHVLTFISSQAFYNPGRYAIILLYVVLVIFVLGSAIGLSTQYIFIKPFDALIDSLEHNNMPHTLSIEGLNRKDEFGLLAKTIQKLSDRLVSSVPVGLFLLDSDGMFLYGNTYFLNQLDLESTDEFFMVYGKDLSSIFCESEDFQRFNQSITENLTLNFLEAQLKPKSQKSFWAEIHLIRNPDHKSPGFEGILLNIQLKKEYEKELINLATVDPLTNLYNRRYFDEEVKKEIARSKRHRQSLSLILFDLDHFKQINDVYGHIVGDEILAVITRLASECLRASDTIARWGGEEFSILLPETPLQGAYHVAEKIRHKIASYEHAILPKITASFGIAEYRQDETFEDWFERVDHYLYYAKDSGRNRVYGLSKDYNTIDQLIKLSWHKSFASGNPIIDDQHKELFNIANSIISNSMKISSQAAQKHAIVAFYEFVKKHFEDEAYILKSLGYPQDLLESHIDSHNRLLDKIEKETSREDLSQEDVMKIGMMLIQEVVYEHMIQEDSKFYAYTKEPSKEL